MYNLDDVIAIGMNISNYIVQRLLIYIDNSSDIVFYDSFKKMEIFEEELKK